MRKDSTQYIINVEWDEDRNEFIATFNSFDAMPRRKCTYGNGDTKGLAIINLIENAKKWEIEE